MNNVHKQPAPAPAYQRKLWSLGGWGSLESSLSSAACVKARECVITDQHAHAVLFASQRDLSQWGKMKACCYFRCIHLSLNVPCIFSKQCGVSFHWLQNMTCLFAILQKPLISISLSLSLFLPFLYVLVVVVWGPHITHSTLSLCPSGRRARLWVAVCPIDHQRLLSRCVRGKHSCEALMQNDHWVWCHLERGYTRAKATQTATRDRETDWSCVSDYFLSFSL